MNENVIKVYLTEREQYALCVAISRFNGQEEPQEILVETAERFALKDALLKLKAMVAPDPVHLTKPELEALLSVIDSVRSGKHLRNVSLKLEMALYPEEGVPQ